MVSREWTSHFSSALLHKFLQTILTVEEFLDKSNYDTKLRLGNLDYIVLMKYWDDIWATIKEDIVLRAGFSVLLTL